MNLSATVRRSVRRHPVGVLALAVVALGVTAPHASARTLAEVRALGVISLCASPETLPYASDKAGEDPGFQVELGRAIAEGLGLKLSIEWVVPRRRANVVNCDMQLDTVSDRSMYEGRVLLSRPYQKSGVALGVTKGAEPVNDYRDLAKDQKVGVMVSSVASVVLGKAGKTVTPYAFQTDMITEMARGDMYGCAASVASLSWYVRQHPESGVRIAYAFDSAPELTWNVSVGLRKSDAALVDEVNKVLGRLLEDGTVTRIYARYGIEHRQP